MNVTSYFIMIFFIHCKYKEFQAIQFIQTVLIQPIQFSISIDFVYTLLKVKTILF